MLALNHLIPVEFDREALLREVTADFAGPVVIGEDLLSIDVPRRTVGFAGLRLALGSA
jgi:ribonuclease Z